jgi:phenylpyruvate tautomerase PptA (4-oxalocrotonate tautomerase family)
MPIYQCITPAGTVSDAVRPQIAKEITRLHVEATNAPPSFVHVIILDVPPRRALHRR